MSVVITLLAALAPVILKAFWARQDITDAAKLKLLQSMEPAIRAAGEWRAQAWADPVRAAQLGVMPNAPRLRLHDPDRDSTRNPNEHPV